MHFKSIAAVSAAPEQIEITCCSNATPSHLWLSLSTNVTPPWGAKQKFLQSSFANVFVWHGYFLRLKWIVFCSPFKVLRLELTTRWFSVKMIYGMLPINRYVAEICSANGGIDQNSLKVNKSPFKIICLI